MMSMPHRQMFALSTLVLMVSLGVHVESQAPPQATAAQLVAVKQLEVLALASQKTAPVGLDIMHVFGYTDLKCPAPAKQLTYLAPNKDRYYINFLVYELDPCAWPPQQVGPIAPGNVRARPDNGSIIFVLRKAKGAGAVLYLTVGTLALRATAVLEPPKPGRIHLITRAQAADGYKEMLQQWLVLAANMKRIDADAERVGGDQGQ